MPADETTPTLTEEARAEVEGPTLSLFGSISVLTVITVLVAASSECVTATPHAVCITDTARPHFQNRHRRKACVNRGRDVARLHVLRIIIEATVWLPLRDSQAELGRFGGFELSPVMLRSRTCVQLPRRFLTGSIEEVSAGTGVGRLFLGLIVLPIAGNAAEHITAVFVAAKDKMDLAIAVALGSSIQARLLPHACTMFSLWLVTMACVAVTKPSQDAGALPGAP